MSQLSVECFIALLVLYSEEGLALQNPRDVILGGTRQQDRNESIGVLLVGIEIGCRSDWLPNTPPCPGRAAPFSRPVCDRLGCRSVERLPLC